MVKQIHRDIGRPWSLKLLAAEAGMSRSAFAVHFKDITGITPGDYLTHWRMYRARCLLRHPQLTLAKIAEMVGYDSGITLGRAFKRFTGVTAGNIVNGPGRDLTVSFERKLGIMLNLNNDHLLILAKTAVNPD